jgi:FSR family fosmidomycin resistance protein-like MFS transporter
MILDALVRPQRLVPAAYGAAHAVVDATTVAVVFGAIGLHAVPIDQAFYLVVGYDVLAFASQALLGLVTDRLQAPRAVALLGLVVTAFSLVALGVHAGTAVIVAGLGNALFHVGAGALSLAIEPGRAAAPGIFVGPGALGLAVGIWVGHHGPFATWPFFVALGCAVALVALVATPEAPYARLPAPARVDHVAPIVALLLLSIAVRSFVGLGAAHATPKSLSLSFGLALAACSGKVLGGLLSDRLGWLRTSVVALLASAPILAFGARQPSAMVFGMFLFQMTMPVTLAALTFAFPRRPAFVFGLACVALVAGALATFSRGVTAHYSSAGFFGLIVLSALALFVGLRMLGERAVVAPEPVGRRAGVGP